jgi:hypothetical protein
MADRGPSIDVDVEDPPPGGAMTMVDVDVDGPSRKMGTTTKTEKVDARSSRAATNMAGGIFAPSRRRRRNGIDGGGCDDDREYDDDGSSDTVFSLDSRGDDGGWDSGGDECDDADLGRTSAGRRRDVVVARNAHRRPWRCLSFALVEAGCLVMSAAGCGLFLAGLVLLCMYLAGPGMFSA